MAVADFRLACKHCDTFFDDEQTIGDVQDHMVAKHDKSPHDKVELELVNLRTGERRAWS